MFPAAASFLHLRKTRLGVNLRLLAAVQIKFQSSKIQRDET